MNVLRILLKHVNRNFMNKNTYHSALISLIVVNSACLPGVEIC